MLKFHGDVAASQVERLREEVTAILSLKDYNKRTSTAATPADSPFAAAAASLDAITATSAAVVTPIAPTRDKVIVVLESGGGTVTGYGLAAAQLARIKEAGLGSVPSLYLYIIRY